MIPGEFDILPGTIELNAGRETLTVRVANTGDRPIQVGISLPLLRGQRGAALRPRGDARHAARHPRRHGRALRARPEPYRAARRLGGARRVFGFSGRDSGGTSMAVSSTAARTPTCTARPTGDRVRLARHGPVGRNRARPDALRRRGQVRRRQGHPRRHGAVASCPAPRSPTSSSPTPSSSTTGASSRPTSASRTGASAAIGKAGNPDVQPGVDIIDRRRAPRSSPARAGSSPPAASTRTSTSSARSRSTRRSPRGVTTLLGGGTGPGHRHRRDHLHARALAHRTACCRRPTRSPSTSASSARATRRPPRPLREQVARRRHRPQAARGLGHDAGGDRHLPAASPTSTTCRSRSTPTRSTSRASSRRRIAAFKGRTIHTFHTEGAGGGHAPDIIRVVRRAQRAALARPTRRARTRQHDRRAPRHADGVPPPRPGHPRGRRLRRVAASGARPSPPRTSSTTSARSR